MKTGRYDYEPTAKDVDSFEAIWLVLWHPRFKVLSAAEYMLLKNFAFEAFIVGINQNKYDIRFDLENLLGAS